MTRADCNSCAITVGWGRTFWPLESANSQPAYNKKKDREIQMNGNFSSFLRRERERERDGGWVFSLMNNHRDFRDEDGWTNGDENFRTWSCACSRRRPRSRKNISVTRERDHTERLSSLKIIRRWGIFFNTITQHYMAVHGYLSCRRPGWPDGLAARTTLNLTGRFQYLFRSSFFPKENPKQIWYLYY